MVLFGNKTPVRSTTTLFLQIQMIVIGFNFKEASTQPDRIRAKEIDSNFNFVFIKKKRKTKYHFLFKSTNNNNYNNNGRSVRIDRYIVCFDSIFKIKKTHDRACYKLYKREQVFNSIKKQVYYCRLLLYVPLCVYNVRVCVCVSSFFII